MPDPLVSIVIAAFGRPEVLACAMESIRAQQVQDWELLVVADACEPTARFMQDSGALADPRIRFWNLSRNVGDQSGPNNFGTARSRGRFLAFLNQDDLWFPDHLGVCLEHLDTTGADIVFSYSGALVPASREELAAGLWLGGITGVPQGGRWDPVRTFAPASSWVLRRKLVRQVGPWRPARECFAAPSHDFLYRAWRRGLAIRCCPELTVLIFSSGGRKDSYLQDLSHEQAWWLRQAGLDDLTRAALWHRLAYQHPQPDGVRRRLAGGLQAAGRGLLHGLARLGVDPVAARYRLGHWRRPGDYLDSLRVQRGLGRLTRPGQDLAQAHRRVVERTCAYCWDQVLDFSRRGQAHRYQLDGWAFPEEWGCWTEGPRARMLLRLPDQRPPMLLLRLQARGLIARGHRQQRIQVGIDGVGLACLRVESAEPASFRVRFPAGLLTNRAPAVLEFVMFDSVVPARLTGAPDHRRLGLGIGTLSIGPAPPWTTGPWQLPAFAQPLPKADRT